MTRLRFLLVSFFAAVGTCFGVDRERMARRWLEANGFEIDERFQRLTPDEGPYYTIWHTRIGLKSLPSTSMTRRDAERLNEPCWRFLNECLDPNGFMIIERHVVVDFPVVSRATDWADIQMAHREVQPPTIHRFERPWFV